MDVNNRVWMYTGDTFHGSVGTIIRIDADGTHWVRTRTKMRNLFDVPCQRAELQYAYGKSSAARYADAYMMDVAWSDEDECYIVKVPELPGCVSHGRTLEEARRRGRDAIQSYIDACIGWGDSVPSPIMKEAS